jgi:hypothetical protein
MAQTACNPKPKPAAPVLAKALKYTPPMLKMIKIKIKTWKIGTASDSK